MLLDAIDKSIEIVLAAAKTATDSPITTFYVDHTDAGGTPGSSDTTTNGVTAVTAVAAPAVDTERQVKMITVYNAEQVSIIVYTQLNHGGTTRIMNCSTLAAGESLIYQNEIGFRIATPTGIFFCDVTDRVGRLVGRTTFYDTLINATIDAAAETVELSCSGLGSIGIQIADSGGAWVGTLSFEGTIDGTNWTAIRAVKYGGILVFNTTINGIFFAQAGGLLKIRIRASAWTSGTCSIYMEGTTATNAITIANSLPSPFTYAVSQGIITGSTPFSKMGFNSDIDNVEEDMWPNGAKYVFPAAAAGLEVYSADANDTVAGTGIQKIKIYYLDDTYAEKVEEVSLNGGVVATTALNILRVNDVRASQVGVNKVAADNIDVRNLANTPIYRRISLGQTQGRALIYTVPLGKTLYITDVDISSSSTGGNHYTRFTLRATWDDINNVTVGWFNPLFEMTVQDGGMHLPLVTPIKIGATSDAVMSVISDAGAANTICQCFIRGWLE